MRLRGDSRDTYLPALHLWRIGYELCEESALQFTSQCYGPPMIITPTTPQSPVRRAAPARPQEPATDQVSLSRTLHGAGCPCCLQSSQPTVAAHALQGLPGMAVPGYLQMTPELRSRIDALPVKPGEVTHVLYHNKCFDGFGARVAAEARLGEAAQYIGVNYNEAPPALPADAKVAVVDFSYPREQLEALNERVAGLVVLDHHATAKDQLAGLPYTVFEMERAGAGLSWAYFHPDQPEPELLKYVEDRDLWKFRLPESKAVHSALASYPMEFATWQGLDLDQLKAEGATINRYKGQLVADSVERSFMATVAGYRVPVSSCEPALSSEVGHALCERYPDAPFSATYSVKGGKKVWELRSREGGFDVGALARKFGGGGHKAASGFPDPSPGEPTTVDPPA